MERGLKLGKFGYARALAFAACSTPPSTTIAVYTWGHEVSTVQPCGSSEVFWVVASEELSQKLRSAHDSLTSEPYAGIRVEVVMRPSAEEADGFAEHYDGMMEVLEVREFGPDVPEDCR